MTYTREEQDLAQRLLREHNNEQPEEKRLPWSHLTPAERDVWLLRAREQMLRAAEVPSVAPATATAPTPSKVEHPSHYGGADNQYETIRVLEAWLTPEQFIGFCRGNSLRYQSRAGRKSGEAAEDDLKKSRWYTDREIEFRTRKKL